MQQPWRTDVTAFTVTRRDSLWLMLRHTRLGLTRWELPGGHVESGEALEQAAARETAEETGVRVEVGRLLATCVHEWAERRQRKLICFFEAVPVSDAAPAAPDDEAELLEAVWRDPLALGRSSLSPFLHPLVDAHAEGWVGPPLHFAMTHGRNADGLWEPVPQA
ncbi:MAG: NUDIX hydrolase [Angustibacter sp.]